ncbi:MAG TPA: ABC transporter permease [Opitutaceae bacterium]|nr:ABC transporter permease [Opitutaceae bacterium]
MFNDLRLSLRTLSKSPVFVIVAVVTLMLGIGVNTAMFSIVNGAALRGLPFFEQERLLHVENHNLKLGVDSMGMSWLDYADMRGSQTSFEDLAIFQERTFNISGPGGDPERITGCSITHSGPDMLKVAPHMGRWFRADEDGPGAVPVVVIGFTLWQNRFASDPAILGTQLKVNGEWATVVGVGPRDYRFPDEADAWMPMRGGPREEPRDERYWEVMGRLKQGVTLEAARAEIEGIARQLETAHPETNKNVGVTVKPLRDEFVGDGTLRMLSVMLGAVLLVMLIACANVANLLLVRAAVRQKEIAVRTALGSGRARIVRLLLSEALVLSISGAVLGLALGYGLLAIFDHYIQMKAPPYWMVFKIDGASILYVLGLAFVATFFAGLWPAWRTSRTDLTSVLRDGGRGSTGLSLSRFTRVMVVGEVVLSCVLLVLSGLYVRSVIKMQSTSLGFETAGIFTSRIGLPEVEYKELPKQVEFYRLLTERLAARPEVAGVAISSSQPTWNNRDQLVIDGQQSNDENAPRTFGSRVAVSGSYFETLGIELLQGRTFDDRDTTTAPKVAVVSSKFAERYWPGESPLGRRFVYGNGRDVKPESWISVIGVVAPTLHGDFDQDGANMPQAYVPYTQAESSRFMTVFAKSRTGDSAALAAVVRGVVLDLNDDLPIYWPQSLDAMVDDAKFFKWMFAWIFGVFGAVALLLSGVGLYGVMAYSVSQRTQEIGVRMALGAAPRDVLGLILREGSKRLAIGLAIGLTLGFLAGKLQADFLFGITPNDPATYAGTLLTLGVAGLAACLIPALRALRVNPVDALRSE